jgi:hypothetical protein
MLFVFVVGLDLHDRHTKSIQASSTERCFDGYTSNMSAKDVSQLYQVPIVVPEELLNQMPINVRIRPDVLDIGSGVKCGIAIEFNKNYGDKVVIEVYRRDEPYYQSQSLVGRVNCTNNGTSTVLPLNLVRPDARTTMFCSEFGNSRVDFRAACSGTIYKSNLAFDVLILTKRTSIETANLMCSAMFWEPKNN